MCQLKTILSVIVSHNRCGLLARCIGCLQKQSRPADQIVIINNGSTNDTEAVLRERGVHYVAQESVGSDGVC